MTKEYGEVLALIPARGGSKSVPRKNIIPLMGKPMIAWAIECALKAQYITRVIVSTDDEEIAGIAKKYGAEVPFMRPANLAGDLSVDVEFHRHAIEWLAKHENYIPDMVINLRPTPPSRNPNVIDDAIKTFYNNPNVDSLRSVHLAEQSPFKMWTFNEKGLMDPVAEIDGIVEAYNQPRQLLPAVYWQDGYVDITRPEVICEKNSTTGDRILPFIIEDPAIDVDYPDEVGKAEAQLQEKKNKESASSEKNKTSIRHPS